MSKTPNFDKKIGEILKKLKPHKRVCRVSGEEFEVDQQDLDFYKKVKVPPPTLSPDMRYLRRSLYRNARKLFKRKSDLSGKEMISLYRENSPFKIYSLDEWEGDLSEAENAAIDYDFNRSFFDQLHELQLKVPRPALSGQAKGSVNSDYVNNAGYCKNCYMCFFGGISENCMYCTWFLMDKDSSDLFHCNNLELCYECSYCNKCYDLNFGYFCTNCRNSWFLVDCKDCQDCFGCSNLKHKRYCWFNEEVGEKEFKKRLNAVELSDFEVLEKYKKKFAEEVLPKASFQALDIDQYSEDCEGHHIWSSKNCVECFDVQDSEDLKYSRDVAAKFRDSHDVAYTGLDAEMCYEQIAGGEKIQNARFNLFSGFTSLNIDYCDYCGVLENCFGCVGLRKKKFCILNKQYSESDYWKLLDRIKCDMLDRKEYGEFPPFAYATHPYIDSCATEDFDLDQKEFEDILKKDNEYFDIERKSLLGYGTPNNKNNSDAHNFAGDEDLWSDEKILNTTFACEETGQPFKIQKQELEFYKKKGLPLPRLHPETRHRNRFEWRGDRKILDGKCGDCGKTVKTIYPPDFTGKVCCDECYSKSMQ